MSDSVVGVAIGGAITLAIWALGEWARRSSAAKQESKGNLVKNASDYQAYMTLVLAQLQARDERCAELEKEIDIEREHRREAEDKLAIAQRKLAGG